MKLNRRIFALIAGLSIPTVLASAQESNFDYLNYINLNSIESSQIKDIKSSENTKLSDKIQTIDDITFDEYHVIKHVVDDKTNFNDMNLEFLTSNDEEDYGNKFDMIASTKENPLSSGDKITIIESQTPDKIYYPYFINIDYINPEKEDLSLIGRLVPAKNDKFFRFTVEYFKTDGNKYMTLWNNKKREGLFQVEGPYPEQFNFILEGRLEDYEVTSPYGPRNLIIGPGTGGNTSGFHWGTDFIKKGNTKELLQDKNNFIIPIIAPYDGFASFGYKQNKNIDDSTILDELSVGRYISLKSAEKLPVRIPIKDETTIIRNKILRDTIYHCHSFPEKLVEEALPSYATKWWWKKILSDEHDEEWIIENIKTNRDEGRLRSYGIQTEWIPISKGEIIGYISVVGALTENGTGKRTGDHLHWEKRLNWQSTDPQEFLKYNYKEYSSEDFVRELNTINKIISHYDE